MSLLCHDLYTFSLSSMSSVNKLLSIMWRKCISLCTKVIQQDDNHILEYKQPLINMYYYLCVCVYLPCEFDTIYDYFCFIEIKCNTLLGRLHTVYLCFR